jgi:hypothetical protein
MCAIAAFASCHILPNTVTPVQDPIRNVLGGVYADNYGMRLVKADETDEYEKSYPEVRVGHLLLELNIWTATADLLGGGSQVGVCSVPVMAVGHANVGLMLS